MKSAIVTGANGFLGSALTNALVNKGYCVYAIVRNEHSNISQIDKANPNVHIIYCEMENINSLTDVLPLNCDVFFHFAWEGVSTKLRSNSQIQLNNAKYTCDAIYFASRIKCTKFIFASSIIEYECCAAIQDSYMPIPSYTYGVSKFSAHYMGKTIANETGIFFIPIVISNVYGVGDNSSRLIHSTIKKMLSNEITEFTSGEQMYDFIYISDAINAIISISENGENYREYYLGSYSPQPLKEFLLEINKNINQEQDIGLGKLPYYGIPVDYYKNFDLFAIKNDIGYEYEITFSEGIKKTIEWVKLQERIS